MRETLLLGCQLVGKQLLSRLRPPISLTREFFLLNEGQHTTIKRFCFVFSSAPLREKWLFQKLAGNYQISVKDLKSNSKVVKILSTKFFKNIIW